MRTWLARSLPGIGVFVAVFVVLDRDSPALARDLLIIAASYTALVVLTFLYRRARCGEELQR